MTGGFHDHSFTLQAIMDLKGTMAELNTKFDTLKSSVDGMKTKVDDLVRLKHLIIGGAVVLGVVGTGLWTVAWKLSEYVQLKQPPQAAAAPTQQVAAPAPPPATAQPK